MTALTYNNNAFRHSFAEEEPTSQPIRRRFHNADMYNLGKNNDGPARSTRLAKIGGHAAAKDEVVKPTKTRCRKRKQVKRACSNCRKAHSACGKQRPCPRCVLRKEEHKCVDTPRKKRIIDGEEEEDEDAEIENEHNTVSTPPSSDDDSTSSVGTSEHSSPIDTGFVVAAPTAVKQTRRNYYKRRRPLPKFNPQNVFKQEQDTYRPTATRSSLQLGSPQIKREVHSTKYAPMDTFQQQLDVKLPLTDTTFLQQQQQQQQQPLSAYYPTYYSQQVLQQQQPQQQLPAFFFQDELLDQQLPSTTTTTTAYPPQQYEQQPQQQQQPLPQQQQQQVPYSFSFTPLTTFNDVVYGHNATLQPSVDDVDFYNNMNNNNNNNNLGSWDCSTGFDDFSSDPDGNSLEREVEQLLGCSDPTGRASLAASLPLQDYPWL